MLFTMRTIAIGDIHGCFTALKTLMDLIQPSQEDLIIPLGDYVDRGPDSRRVLDYFIHLKTACRVIPLVGNHEIQLLRAFQGEPHLSRFLSDLCGGKTTLANYGGNLSAIPSSHLEFMRTAELYYETSHHIFVHAGVHPKLPMAEQNPEVLYYQRFHIAKPHYSGKTVICGHTIQGDYPENLGHSICIDTCAYGGGWLTALDVETGQLWQSNQKREHRSYNISELTGLV